MANRLKIYACSGIGEATNSRVPFYKYWTDNTNTLNNTQAVNLLLTDINLLYSSAENLQLEDSEFIRCLNSIDLYVVCLDAAKKYAQHYTILEKAGRVIGTMLSQGQFDYESTDSLERDRHLDELIDWFEDAIQKNDQYVLASDEFLAWWQENVIALNKIGFSASEREKIQTALSNRISGIGDLDWHNNKELAEYLSNAGTYFLYTYFTDKQLNKLPYKNRVKFIKKRNDQLRIYEYCKKLYVGTFGKESAMQNIIRTGIQDRYKDTPENVCESIVNGKIVEEGTGSLSVTVILAIISAVLAVVLALIENICKAVAQSKTAEYASIDDAIIKDACPEKDDFEGFEAYYQKAKSWFPLIAIGAALFWLLKGNN